MTAALASVRYKRATAAQRAGGLEGWISFTLAGLVAIDGVALRRSCRGAYVFSWPARKDERGRLHHHVRPLDEQARHAIECALLTELFVEIREDAA